MRPAEPGIEGDERGVERFGESDVEGIVGGDRVAQCPHACEEGAAVVDHGGERGQVAEGVLRQPGVQSTPCRRRPEHGCRLGDGEMREVHRTAVADDQPVHLGPDPAAWADSDACRLIASGARVPALRVDQGAADGFLETQLMPERLRATCAEAGQPLELTLHEGYDHSYYFISSLMGAHLDWHARHLAP